MELGLELAPGETQILYYGGRGKGYANRIPAADCVMADWLEAVYTDSQGNEVPIPLERRCIWIELKTDPRGPVRRVGLLLPLSGHQP